MYIMFARNVCIFKKIEYPELRKSNDKFFTSYTYEMSGFVENWISRTTKIQWDIVYIIYVRNFWICRKIEYPELGKFNRKLSLLNVRNVWVCKKIEYPELHKFYRKLCTLYVWNVWIWRKIYCPKLRKFNGNCVHNTYGMSRFAEKLKVKTAEIQRETVYIIFVQNVWICKRNWISRTPKIQREIVYIIYVRKGWICRKIECPELRKFNGKFCTIYVRNV